MSARCLYQPHLAWTPDVTVAVFHQYMTAASIIAYLHIICVLSIATDPILPQA